MRLAALIITTLAFAAPAAAGTVVKTAHNTHLKATILVDARGRTLYYFVSDTGGTSACTDDSTYHCSRHWVPLRTTDDPVAKGGAQQGLLATTQRDDGTLQVTYKNRPLYTWTGGYGTKADRKPGDVYGQNFASLWYVLSPAGKPVKTAPK